MGNYDRLVSMTRFAATVRAGGACAAITCHGQREEHRHARTTVSHHVGALIEGVREYHLLTPKGCDHACSEAPGPVRQAP